MKIYIGALVIGIVLMGFGFLGYRLSTFGFDAQQASNPVYLYILFFGLMVCILSIGKIILYQLRKNKEQNKKII